MGVRVWRNAYNEKRTKLVFSNVSKLRNENGPGQGRDQTGYDYKPHAYSED